MKILFVASKSAKEAGLELEKEITGIQLRVNSNTANAVEFTFLPDLSLEQLQHELIRRRPDVLHLSAHGSKDALALRRENDPREVLLTGRALLAFLNPEKPPRLVYLNACNSDTIARELSERVPLAIGNTSPITNASARAGAVAFYDFVFSGYSVFEAHRAQQAAVEILEGGLGSVSLHSAEGVDPASVILHHVPRLEADFEDTPKPDKRGSYHFTLRLVGCPPSTTQVIFFTDDEDFLEDEDENDDEDGDYNYEDNLSYLVRGCPIGANLALTTYDGEPWSTAGDFRLFAVGVTGDMRMFTASSTLVEALERRYRNGMPPAVRRAIVELKSQDGAADEPTIDRPRKQVRGKSGHRTGKRRRAGR